MKIHLLFIAFCAAATAVAQVGIEPFAPAVPGTYLGNFTALTNGADIPSTSPYTESGDIAGPNNNWTVDDGTVIAPFTGGIGKWASGTCENGQNLYLISPEMDFGTNTLNTEVSFRYIIDNGAVAGFPGAFGNLNLDVVYKTSAGGAWTTVGTYTLVDNVWHNQTASLGGAGSYATFYLGFRIYGVSAGSFYSYGFMGLDEIVVTGQNTGCTPTSSVQSVTACGSYTSPSGLYTWTTTGSHNDTIPNVAGCDSVMTFNLTINNANVGVTQTGNSLMADATGAAYQWLDCNNAYAAVSGATGQTFNAAVDGSYSVKVTENGCTDTSACFAIIGLGLHDSNQELVGLFPNPTNGNVQVTLGTHYQNAIIIVSNLSGQVVQTHQNFTTPNTSIEINGERGVYFVEIITNSKSKVIKVIKN